MLLPILGFLFVVIILYIYYNYRSGLPGPWNLPIIGYLHKIDPNLPNITFTKLAQKYGPVYSIKLGSMDTVVISDPKILKKVLMKDEALARPPLFLFNILFGNKGIVTSPTNIWKEQRKFIHNYLRTSGATKLSSKKITFEEQARTYAEEFIDHILGQGDRVTLYPFEPIVHYVGSISSTLIFGTIFTRDDETLLKIENNFKKMMLLAPIGGPLNYLPFLRFLPKFKQTVASLTKVVEETRQMVFEVSQTHTTLKLDENSPSSLTEAFWLQRAKFGDDESYDPEQLRYLLYHVFGASLETSVNTIMWFILHMAQYQQVQEKVRHELVTVLQGKAPTVQDLTKLPYTQATIAEVFRIRTIIPLGLPHYTLQDVQVDDIKIRKGTTIMSLLWAIHMDPKVWKEPEEFRPERFLNDEGNFFSTESFLPFQAGKRMCVGKDMGNMIIFLFVATVLQKLKIESCDSAPVDMSYVCGFTLMSKPQKITFVRI